MKKIIQIEELGIFLFGIYLFALLPFAWWWFPLLLLVPDFSMLGYLLGNKAGAAAYNVFHHRAIALGLYMIGIYTGNSYLQLAGVIIFSHASMDRIFGYGLKYEQGFKFTHLGKIGKEEQ